MKKVTMYVIIFLVIMILIVYGINLYVKMSTKGQIIEENGFSKLIEFDYILVLGAGVWGITLVQC